jgi:hypothetical protein
MLKQKSRGNIAATALHSIKTQLVALDFRELLDLTLTKVVSGDKTCDFYISISVKNNEFWQL